MKTETKNKILELRKTCNLTYREISKITKVPISTIHVFLRKNYSVLSFETCLNCGKEIVIRVARGRPSKFCCDKCRHAYYRNEDVANVKQPPNNVADTGRYRIAIHKYISSMTILQNLYKEGLVTENDLWKISKRLLKKYEISEKSVFNFSLNNMEK